MNRGNKSAILNDKLNTKKKKKNTKKIDQGIKKRKNEKDDVFDKQVPMH